MGQARRQREADRARGVVIGFLHPGMVSAYFTTSLVQMLLYDQGTSRTVVGMLQEWSSANVSAARNEIVRRFLERDDRAPWLLFIDSDMAWDHDALDRLMIAADPETAPIIGGLCFGAVRDRLFPTIYRLTPTDDGGLTTTRVGDYPRDRLVPCDATGAAFLLIHRDVLEVMRDRGFNKTFPWFQETELGGLPAGEDLTFCLRARGMGVPIHVDTRVKVGHHKSSLYTEALFDSQLSQEA
jgi:GT2 family glycosyltransferase